MGNVVSSCRAPFWLGLLAGWRARCGCGALYTGQLKKEEARVRARVLTKELLEMCPEAFTGLAEVLYV